MPKTGAGNDTRPASGMLAPFRAGVCDTRLVVYSVTVTAFFLLVAVQALALRRLR